ncbi:MAG: metallophosphoesterase [Proteobacteria bacterium]|nr:metallophosphoesterase [Pseudomonadota bacterium]
MGWRRAFSGLFLLGVLVAAKGYWNATRDPVVRRASLAVPGLKQPIRVLALSDVHVAGPDMPPQRLARIVTELNTLQPDLVVIAGDMVSEKRLATHIYPANEVVEPLGGLQARLGVIATLGNHDHWFGAQAIVTNLRKRGIVVLENEAIDIGPLIVGGVGDDFTAHADAAATFAAMAALGTKPKLIVTHSPDAIPAFPESVAAIFAGHTHCGQIALPFYGPVSTMSRFGSRYACGVVSNAGQTTFVGAGLGTSILPLRFGAAPDVWLVTLEPAP